MCCCDVPHLAALRAVSRPRCQEGYSHPLHTPYTPPHRIQHFSSLFLLFLKNLCRPSVPSMGLHAHRVDVVSQARRSHRNDNVWSRPLPSHSMSRLPGPWPPHQLCLHALKDVCGFQQLQLVSHDQMVDKHRGPRSTWMLCEKMLLPESSRRPLLLKSRPYRGMSPQ